MSLISPGPARPNSSSTSNDDRYNGESPPHSSRQKLICAIQGSVAPILLPSLFLLALLALLLLSTAPMLHASLSKSLDSPAAQIPYISASMHAVRADPNAPTVSFLGEHPDPSPVSGSAAATHRQFGGSSGGSLSVNEDWITLIAERSPFVGERIQGAVSSTARHRSENSPGLVQSGFHLGLANEQCVAGLIEVGTEDDALVPVMQGTVGWIDYDSDGDLDLLTTGRGNTSRETILYRNEGGTLYEVGTEDDSMVDVVLSSAEWGDFDKDGDPDLILTGESPSLNTRIYRNDDGTFNEVGTEDDSLDQVRVGKATWGDYDNDGDLDILLFGLIVNIRPEPVAKIYRNDMGTFNESGAVDDVLVPISAGDGAWVDYDQDGDLDIFMTGRDSDEKRTAKLYRNDSGIFVDGGNADDVLTGFSPASSDWGDFDNDGDLDLIVSGWTNQGTTTHIYRNEGGQLVDSGSVDDGLAQVTEGTATWGDLDNDGDLDLLLTGRSGGNFTTKIYVNSGGSFVDSGPLDDALPSIAHGRVAWGDFDNDADLDIALTGYVPGVSEPGYRVTKLYRNEGCQSSSEEKRIYIPYVEK